MIKCWNCNTELDEPLGSARKTETHGQSINTSPPWWNGNIGIDFSTNQWEYVVHGLSALINNAHMLGWASTEVEKEIQDIINHIEKSIHEI